VHYHLAHPGFPVANFARRLPGIDFRGDGGYVLLPPSHHASGADYRWVEETDGIPLAVPPDWLLDLIHARGAASEPSADHDTLDLGKVLGGIPEGERDDTLWRYACKLRGDDVPQVYADQLVRLAARQCRPAFDEAAAAEKVRRAYATYAPALQLVVPEARSDPVPREAPEDREPWLVYGAATFLARELPTVAWRIAQFVRAQAIVWTFGAPGTIKTYIATDAALAVASGGLFLGTFPCQRGKVLVVQEDTLEADYQQAYLRPLLDARGLDPTALEDWLFIAPQAGMRLDDGTRLQELRLWLEAHRPALVILDAFYLLHAGEGYGKEMRALVNTLRALRTDADTAIWIIDHDRKGGDGRDKDNPIDRLIGGREKSGGADAVIEIEAVKGKAGAVVLSTRKLRGGKPEPPLEIQLEDGRLQCVTVNAAAKPGAAEAVYDWLRLEGGTRSKKQIMSGCDIAERTANYAINTLTGRRLLRYSLGGTRNQERLYYALSEPYAEGEGQDLLG
jgi:hypothetical protein